MQRHGRDRNMKSVEPPLVTIFLDLFWQEQGSPLAKHPLLVIVNRFELIHDDDWTFTSMDTKICSPTFYT